MVFLCSTSQVCRRVWPLLCPLILSIPVSILYGIYYGSDIVNYLNYSDRVIYGEITIDGFHSDKYTNQLAFDRPHFNGTGYAMGKWYKIDTTCTVWSNWFPARRIIDEVGCHECEICYTEARMKQFENGCSREIINICRQERQNGCIGDIIKTLYPKVRGFTNVFNPCEEIQVGSKLSVGDVPYTDTDGAYAGFIIAYMFTGMFALVIVCFTSELTCKFYCNKHPPYICYTIPSKSCVKCQKQYSWFERFVAIVCCTCYATPPKFISPELLSDYIEVEDKDLIKPIPPPSTFKEEEKEIPITRPNEDIPVNIHDRDDTLEQDASEIPKEIQDMKRPLKLHHFVGMGGLDYGYVNYIDLINQKVLPREIPDTENHECFISDKPIRGKFFHCPTCSTNVSLLQMYLFVMKNGKCPNCETRLSTMDKDVSNNLYGYVKYE